MKLPHREDPQGNSGGALPRPWVLDVLFRHRINVSHNADGTVEMSDDDWIETHALPEMVGGNEIRQIARAFSINIRWSFITFLRASPISSRELLKKLCFPRSQAT